MERGCLALVCDSLTSGHCGMCCVPRAGHCRAQVIPCKYKGQEVLVHFLVLPASSCPIPGSEWESPRAPSSSGPKS